MRALFARSLIVVLVFAVAASAQKRNITEKDLFDFIWIGDPQVSPDGSTVAFVRVTVNDKKDGYNTSIWSVSSTGGDEPRRLTSGNRDSSPRLVTRRQVSRLCPRHRKDGKPDQAQLFMLVMSGGDSFQLTNFAERRRPAKNGRRTASRSYYERQQIPMT